MIREAIEKVVKGTDLAESEMIACFDEIMSGNATSAQIGAFITALRIKGETVDEITGAAKVMRQKSIHIAAGSNLVDTCGTGGTGTNTFNVSTVAAFVAAGCGLKVAKHGNRGASSLCGSADVLEALGVRIDSSPDMVQRCILEIGIGFLFAPIFHSAMKYAAASRKEIGIRTIFNLLGPLSNPAGATHQVVGVYDSKLTEKIANVLKNLGAKKAFVVCGMDTLDEITVTGKTKVSELNGSKIKTYYVIPQDFGLRRSQLSDIEGGRAKENADIIMSVLKGERGPRRDIVLMNASTAIVCGGKAANFKKGVKMAEESIDSGKALQKLLELIEITNR